MSSLPFVFPGFLVTEVIATSQQLAVYATSQATQAVCPRCQEISSRVHILPYIQLRRSQGCSNMVQLHHERRERGYQGSYAGMRHILLRVFPKEQKWQRTPAAKREDPLVSLSPREAMWLFLRQPNQLTQRDHQWVEHLCQLHEEVAIAYHPVQQFALMVREREGGQLDTWLDAVAQSSLRDLQPFVKGIKSDIEAVEAGLILPWSNGQVEGHVTRIKLIKRMMYGKAGFALLRQRVLHRV